MLKQWRLKFIFRKGSDREEEQLKNKKATQWEKEILDLSSKAIFFNINTQETQTNTCLSILRPYSLVLMPSFNFLLHGLFFFSLGWHLWVSCFLFTWFISIMLIVPSKAYNSYLNTPRFPYWILISSKPPEICPTPFSTATQYLITFWIKQTCFPWLLSLWTCSHAAFPLCTLYPSASSSFLSLFFLFSPSFLPFLPPFLPPFFSSFLPFVLSFTEHHVSCSEPGTTNPRN